MSATLDYEIKKALPFLTKDNRWNVLTVLILHANVRNRCWPSIQTIADMATNGNRNRATRAKNWLQKHGVFALVPTDKRVDEEIPLNGKQLIYQLTGVITACKDEKCQCEGFEGSIHYLYKTNKNGDERSIHLDTTDTGRSANGDTTRDTNGVTTRSMNGDTRSIPTRTPKKKKKTEREKLLESLSPYLELAHSIMLLIEVGYTDIHKPAEFMTNAKIKKYLPHLEELKRMEVTPNELKGVYAHFNPTYEQNGWTFGVSTFEEKLPSYRALKAKTPARKPAPITPFDEPTAAELEAQRAELEAARKAIRPEWEQKAVVNE